METLEKILWTLSFLGILCLLALMFIGQTSYIQDSDIQIREEGSVEKQQQAFLDAIRKYVKDPNELKRIEAQIQQAKAARANNPSAFVNSSQPGSIRNTIRGSSNDVIREADPNMVGYLPPNTSVKMVSSDFKEKYANSFQEVMGIAQQAGSRFVNTPEGPRPQIIWINQGTMIARLGFRPGDVIMRVNGRPVSSIQDGQGLYNALKNDREFLIEAYRQGKLHRFVYKIE